MPANPRVRIGLGVAIGILVVGKGVPALHAAIETSRQAAEQRAVLLSRTIALIGDGPRDSLRLAEGRQRLDSLRGHILQAPSRAAGSAAFINVISDIAASASVTADVWQVIPDSTDLHGLSVLAISGTLVGNASGVTAFLGAVNEHGTMMQIRRLQVDVTDPVGIANGREVMRVGIEIRTLLEILREVGK